MKVIDLTKANLLNELIESDGWKVLQEVVEGILSDMEKKILQRDIPNDTRNDMVVDYYRLKDFMKIPATQINRLSVHEKIKEIKRKNYDPYPATAGRDMML